MAIRTTIVNKTKNADGTYSEKEIHPFTDMNAVVSLEPVSGNYDAYTNLPLEGAPQNALTAFLNTRSYLYSLREFKNKTVTNNYTETTNLTTKVPSMQALKNAYDECQRSVVSAMDNANANANTRIPLSSITNDYDVSNPSDSLVLNQTGANALFKNLYRESFLNNLILTILNAPIRYVSPIYFNDDPNASKSSGVCIHKTYEDSYCSLCSGTTTTEPDIPTFDFFKISFFDMNHNPNCFIALDTTLQSGKYNTNDLYRGRYYTYPGTTGGGIDMTKPYLDNAIIKTELPRLQEEVIIAVYHKKGKYLYPSVIYHNGTKDSYESPKSFKYVNAQNKMYSSTVFAAFDNSSSVPNRIYTVEYCDMRIDGYFALELEKALNL